MLTGAARQSSSHRLQVGSLAALPAKEKLADVATAGGDLAELVHMKSSQRRSGGWTHASLTVRPPAPAMASRSGRPTGCTTP
jgi:hypothetical protein